MIQVWLSAAGLALATFIGVGLGFFIKDVPDKWNDRILGFCAGFMLGVSCIEILPEAFEAAGEGRWWIALGGALLGLAFMKLMHHAVPHHGHDNQMEAASLFVLAIALHKIPDGIATGVGFNAEDTTAAWSVTLGIALHSIPEGMAIIAPLLLAGVSRLKTLGIALLLVALEVGGVWLGYGLGSISEVFFAIMLAFSGASLIYVVFEEMIPAAYSHGNKSIAAMAVTAGIFIMMLVEAI